MKDHSSTTLPPSHSYSDSELFRLVWTRPRVVFRHINNTSYRKYFYVFLALAGISNALDRAVIRDMGDSASLATIILLAIAVGGLLGWISLYIYAGLISITGNWLKGKANLPDIYPILAYAMLPAILGILLYVPQVAVLGNGVFQSEPFLDEVGTGGMAVYWISVFGEFVLGIYTLVFVITGVSEVQQLSIGKTIVNLLLPIFLIAIPILILVGIVTALST